MYYLFRAVVQHFCGNLGTLMQVVFSEARPVTETFSDDRYDIPMAKFGDKSSGATGSAYQDSDL